MTRVVTLKLSLPPSANRLWRVGRGKVYPNPKYTAWKRDAATYKAMQRPEGGYPLFEGAFDLQIVLPLKTTCDPTNYVKALEDFLQSSGIIANDKHSRGTTITRSEDVEKGFVRLFVFDAKAAA